ncbi:MAG: response regulator [Pseudomonadota bacterium]
MRKRALLVEDNDLNRLLFSEILIHAGFAVVPDATGESAFELARANALAIAVIDLALPSQPGLQLIRTLRQTPSTRGIPIIAVSAHARTEDGLAALEAGADLFFCKPVDTHRLAAALTALCDKGEREANVA